MEKSLRSQIRELKYELERYERGCKLRDQMIGIMREEMHGQEQVHRILAAYIAELIGEEEREIDKAAITEKIGKYRVAISDNAENGTYKVKSVKVVTEEESK